MQKEIHIVLGLCALFVWSILSLLLISGQPATTVLIMDVILCFLFSLLLYISSKIRRICIVLLLMASFFQSIVCILQSFDVLVSKHSLFDVTGFMGNPGLLGGFQAVSAVVILCLLLKTESVGAKTFLSFLLVIVSISLVLSDSRAAFVGFGVGVITVFLNPILDFLKHKKWLILICIISVIVILIALYLYRPNSANVLL